MVGAGPSGASWRGVIRPVGGAAVARVDVVSDDVESGGYWYHRRPADTHAAVRDVAFQDALLEAFAELV